MINLLGHARLLIATILIFCSLIASAQVDKVKYHLRYNEAVCLWEMCLVIEEGAATAPIHRAQFNSQISIVVPTGSIFTIEKSFMPLQANQNYTGTKPLTWFVNNFLSSPQSQPQSDFIGIAPVLNPTSFFNNIKAKDTIMLFRASISGLSKCSEGVRIYENGKDPDSSAPGMNGGDFSNGYTMGSLDQKYSGNVKTKGPSLPIVKNLMTDCSNGLSISFTTSLLPCHGSNTFLWKGPNGFTTTNQNVSIPNATNANNGEYTLYIADNLGCKDTVSVVANAAPNAGADSYVRCYTSGVGVLQSSTPGEWQILSAESAGTAIIVDVDGLNSEVRSFSAKGFYTFERDNGQCADKVKIYVDDVCNCSAGNIISTVESTEFCGKAEDVKLEGGQLAGDDYLWIYKFNSGNFRLAPGANIFQDYTTLALGKGDHTFRRIYTNQNGTCADTSQAIIITVKDEISTQGDTVLQCYKDATVNLKAFGDGYWVVNSENPGLLNLSNYLDRNAVVSQFSQPGIYKLIWTNDFCSDTVVIDAKPWCGCFEAKVDESKNLCQGDKIVLNGSCSNGKWDLLGVTTNVAKIDSVVNGNAYLTFDWKTIPNTFKAIFNVEFGPLVLSDTMTLYKRISPNLELGENFDYCRGSEDVIISTAGATNGYLWSNGATSRYILVSPEVTTKYGVIARNDFGCKGYDTVTVFVHEKPKGQLPSSIKMKVGEKLTINSGFWTEAIDYIWTGPNDYYAKKKNLVIENMQFADAGVYTLAVMSAYDCYTYATVRVDVVAAALTNPTNVVVGEQEGALETRIFKTEIPSVSHKLNIVPNPSTTITKLSFAPYESESTLLVYNHLGQVVIKDVIASNVSAILLNGQDLQAGIYSVLVLNGNNRTSARWIIVD